MLTDAELLALVLGTGCRGRSASELASGQSRTIWAISSRWPSATAA